MLRIKIKVAYDGTNYSGWQIQSSKNRIQRTIQGELESAIYKLTGCSVRVHGSGRTDSGVHAEGQVAHFDIPEKYLKLNWITALKSKLPSDISIITADLVDDTFHARFSSIKKTYSYSLWLDYEVIYPRMLPYCWQCGPLDIDRIIKAADDLIGEHDFASFQNVGSIVLDTTRCLYSITHFYSSISGVFQDERLLKYKHLCLQFTGNGFLKQMVRNLVGLLVLIGQSKLNINDAKTILNSKSRSEYYFPTAPAKGLTLTSVDYL